MEVGRGRVGLGRVLMCVFLGDIVKQVIKTKLGSSSLLGNNNIGADTIAKLTN